MALTPLHSYLITIFASLKSIIYFQKLSILISTNNNIKIRLTYTHKMPKLQTFVSLIRSSDYPYLYLPISKRRWDIFIDKVPEIANTLLINLLINPLISKSEESKSLCLLLCFFLLLFPTNTDRMAWKYRSKWQ